MARVLPIVITKATRKPAKAKWPPEPTRVRSILQGLEDLYPEVECELDRDTPFQLLCATILSAQCTDARVNQVTPALFRKFPDAAAMARAPLPALEKLIKSTGFFRQKAKNLKGTAQALLSQHAGDIPRTLDELIRLPGVARKTASVVLGTAFGLSEGVVVDTHVQRLAMRLALTRGADAKKIEQDLMQVIPKDHWIRFAHQLIWHGRRVCFARKPACDSCALAPFCPSAGLEN
ncbi:MAG: endonuclease III [Deltaproteobacteria bacterium]|nr:endonuclease III [Deltaproteobacteria bacterium]